MTYARIKKGLKQKNDLSMIIPSLLVLYLQNINCKSFF